MKKLKYLNKKMHSKESKIIFMGKSGTGKSWLANKLAGKRVFEESEFEALKYLQEYTCIFQENQTKLAEWPWPERDTHSRIEELYEKRDKYLHIFQKGLKLICFCIRAGVKIDGRDLNELDKLKDLFGAEIISHVCIIITQVNLLNEKEKLKAESWKNKTSSFFVERGIHIQPEMILMPDLNSIYDTLFSPLEQILLQRNNFTSTVSNSTKKYLTWVIKDFVEEIEISKIDYTQEGICYRNQLITRKSILEHIEILSNQETNPLKLLTRLATVSPFFYQLHNYVFSNSCDQNPTLANDIQVITKKNFHFKHFFKANFLDFYWPFRTQIEDKLIYSLVNILKHDSNKTSKSQNQDELELEKQLVTKFELPAEDKSIKKPCLPLIWTHIALTLSLWVFFYRKPDIWILGTILTILSCLGCSEYQYKKKQFLQSFKKFVTPFFMEKFYQNLPAIFKAYYNSNAKK